MSIWRTQDIFYVLRDITHTSCEMLGVINFLMSITRFLSFLLFFSLSSLQSFLDNILLSTQASYRNTNLVDFVIDQQLFSKFLSLISIENILRHNKTSQNHKMVFRILNMWSTLGLTKKNAKVWIIFSGRLLFFYTDLKIRSRGLR